MLRLDEVKLVAQRAQNQPPVYGVLHCLGGH